MPRLQAGSSLVKVHRIFAEVFVVVLIHYMVNTCDGRIPGAIERGPTKVLTAVQGDRVALPCDIISPLDGDEVYLVLWYKNDIATPIYSLDARRGPVQAGRHSPSDSVDRRAYFNTISRPAALEISSLVADDEGDYRCRVDFEKAQTRNYQIGLKILIPPGKPEIRDNVGKLLSGIAGPYNEDESLYLQCESKGGRPTPSLTWWRESKLIDATYDVNPSSTTVQNELIIERLNRKDLMVNFNCQASNNNLTKPVLSSFTLDLNFRPLQVRITSPRQSFVAGRSIQLKCTASGSRPAAMISWSKGGTRFKDAQEDLVTSGNVTVSVFTFVPSPEDHGRLIQCHASNPRIVGSTIEDTWKLDVHFVPQLSLRLGNKLRHSNIIEGNDVYFECTIKANPWVSETGWKFEGQELQTNLSAGVIVSNQSLVLQKVRRVNRGRYSCTATNAEGQGESNHVYLRVQYSPMCKSGQQTVYGAMLHYPVEIPCEVESDPEDVTFRWEFNSSSGTLELVPTTTSGRKSVVHYIPRSDQDYGTLSCWGKNRVGLQTMPCLFVVIPAEPPSAVHNCTVNGETERSFRISCFEGKDGGLNQYFQMEVRTQDSTLLLNMSAQTADFAVRGLNPGVMYTVTLYAYNAKGKSKPVTERASTLAAPESQTRKEDIWQLTVNPILLILLAIAGGIGLVAFSIILYLKFYHRRSSQKDGKHPDGKKHPDCTEINHTSCNSCASDKHEDEKSKHLASDSFVMIESTQPDVTRGNASSRTGAVTWRKSPTSPSYSEKQVETCLTLKLPFKKGSSETLTKIERRKSPCSPNQPDGVTTTTTYPNSILLHHRPSDDHTSSEIISMSSLRHTDL